MNNYWQKRSEESVNRYESTVNQTLKELTRSLEAARKDIQDQIYNFYGRYAKNNQVSLQEAQKALNRDELRDFRSSLDDFRELAENSIGQFNLQLENLSVKSRVTRLEALLMQVDARLQECYQRIRDGVTETVEQVTLKEYYHSQYDLSISENKLYVFAQLPDGFLARVFAYPVMGADISTRLWRQDIDTGFYIRQTLNRMFIEGKPPQYFAEELAKKIGAVQVDKDGNVTGSGKKYEAYRLLYNESSYATNQARLEAYNQIGVPYYEINATLDTHTTPNCRSLDGCIFSVTKGGDVPEKYRKADSEFRRAAYDTDRVVVGVNYPLFHVNCRSVAIPYYETTSRAMNTRAAKDKDGKTIYVPADMKYQEWYDKYIKDKTGE